MQDIIGGSRTNVERPDRGKGKVGGRLAFSFKKQIP